MLNSIHQAWLISVKLLISKKYLKHSRLNAKYQLVWMEYNSILTNKISCCILLLWQLKVFNRKVHQLKDNSSLFFQFSFLKLFVTIFLRLLLALDTIIKINRTRNKNHHGLVYKESIHRDRLNSLFLKYWILTRMFLIIMLTSPSMDSNSLVFQIQLDSMSSLMLM